MPWRTGTNIDPLLGLTFSDLNSGQPYPARSGVYQHPITLLGLSSTYQPLVARRVGDEQSRSLFIRHPLGDGEAEFIIRCDLLGVRALTRSKDLVYERAS